MSIRKLNSPRRKKKLLISPQSKHNKSVFSKCKVSSDCIKRIFPKLPLVDVYGAEIRRVRTEKEVLKLQQNALLIQTLKEEQAPFNASQRIFFLAIVDLQRFSVAVLWKFESNESMRLESKTEKRLVRAILMCPNSQTSHLDCWVRQLTQSSEWPRPRFVHTRQRVKISRIRNEV